MGDLSVFRYTPSGEAKGKSAIASAKQRQGRQAELIMRERDALKAMSDWNPSNSHTSLDSHVSQSNNHMPRFCYSGTYSSYLMDFLSLRVVGAVRARNFARRSYSWWALCRTQT